MMSTPSVNFVIQQRPPASYKIRPHTVPYGPVPVQQIAGMSRMSSVASVSTMASSPGAHRLPGYPVSPHSGWLTSPPSSLSSTALQSPAMTPRRVLQSSESSQLTPRSVALSPAISSTTLAPSFSGFSKDADVSPRNHDISMSHTSSTADFLTQGLGPSERLLSIESADSQSQILDKNSPTDARAPLDVARCVSFKNIPIIETLNTLCEDSQGNSLVAENQTLATVPDRSEKVETGVAVPDSFEFENQQLAKASDKQASWVTTVIKGHVTHAAKMEEVQSKVAIKESKSQQHLEKHISEARAALAERMIRRDARLSATYNRKVERESARKQELSDRLVAKDSHSLERVKYLQLSMEDEQAQKAKTRMTRSASTCERSRRLEDDRKAVFSERVAAADAKSSRLKYHRESCRERRRILQEEARKVLDQFTSKMPNPDEMQNYNHQAISRLMDDVAERGSAGYSLPYTPR